MMIPEVITLTAPPVRFLQNFRKLLKQSLLFFLLYCLQLPLASDKLYTSLKSLQLKLLLQPLSLIKQN